MSITIKIIGPGETMAGPIFTIKNALESNGYPVTIEDEYPCDDIRHIDRCLSLEDKQKVHIKVEHQPWCG